MPYLYTEYRGEEARREATQKPPQGPGFSEKEIHNIERLEVWASSFTDPGEDYTNWKLFDAQGRLISERRMRGY
ncbi:MAG: hypothetical protein ACFFCW_32120 [Candidatus Hodarchaeota archaeon]